MKSSYKNRAFIYVDEEGNIEFDTDAIFSGYMGTIIFLIITRIWIEGIFKGCFDAFQLPFALFFLIVSLLFLGACVYMMVKSSYEGIIFYFGLEKDKE